MFILRTVFKNKSVSNEIIDNRYFIQRKGNSQNNEFEKAKEAFTGTFDDNVLAFLVTKNEIIALRKGRFHYIMTETGKTFEKIIL